MDGKASGEAFVVFNSFEGVKKALQLDKEKMRDRCGGGRGLVLGCIGPWWGFCCLLVDTEGH